MGTSARGFLLFSFAFSSVLSSPEIANPSNEVETKSGAIELGGIANNNDSDNAAINRCIQDGGCTERIGGIEKREITHAGREGEDGIAPMESFRGEKRSRVGFTGMRGKKNRYESSEMDGLEEFIDFLEKRTRMGFNGMRGKRYGEKRSPTAFHGMRGKKSEEYDDEGYDRMTGYGTYEAADREYPPEGDGWEKRPMAIVGMGGRRGNNPEEEEEEEPLLTKRFQFGLTDGRYDLKRGMGFLGIRGFTLPESWSTDDYKRGVQSGTKGKKAQSGFFGMRGKRSIRGFNRFQGEAVDNEISPIRRLSYSVPPKERFRRATTWLRNSKKAKNAFFAVRGKKSSSNENGSGLNLISGN